MTATTTRAPRAATPGQITLIATMAGERNVAVPTVTTFAEASAAITALKATPRPRAARPTFAPLPDVPQGHYATVSRTGNNDLDFWSVKRPTEGRWAGRTFVDRVIGGHADTAVRGAEARAALQAILDAGVAEAGSRYGQEIGRCYRCNRSLTTQESRAAGIGPDCAGRI